MKWTGYLMVALVAGACTKTAVLKETQPLVLRARPPAPPPPPPKRVEVKKEKIQVNEKIHFEFDRAEIRAESFDLVDEIAEVIKSHPEIAKIRVEGHTDAKGSRKYNLDLSQRRADAVRTYLVKKGVEEARLITKGYAFDEPIASNETDDGRAENRRVEFDILERTGPTPPDDTDKTAAADGSNPASGGDDAAATDGRTGDAGDTEAGDEGAAQEGAEQ